MTILDTRTGKAVTSAVLLDHLAAADVVFVGEQHTDPAAHAFELQMLTALHTRVGKRLTLGLEMFERDVQPALDDYAQGKTTEAAFLKASRPWSNYAADYRPLIEFARAHSVPVLASNVPQPLATAVGRRGLSALSAFPAAQYAEDVQTPHDGAFLRFQAVMQDMGGHGGMTMDAATISRFYDAQCLRDATMADSITKRLQAAPDTLLLHINGQFHSDYGDGIPRRVLWQRPLTKVVTISILGAGAVPADAKIRADYVAWVPAPSGWPRKPACRREQSLGDAGRRLTAGGAPAPNQPRRALIKCGGRSSSDVYERLSGAPSATSLPPTRRDCASQTAKNSHRASTA